MKHTRRLQVPADHPSLAGHFPGNPVVPGVVLLDWVMDTLEQWQPDPRVRQLRQAKFLEPVRPQQDLEVELEAGRPGQVKFRCTVADRPVATGVIELS